MELLSNIKYVEMLEWNRFRITFTDDSVMEIANDKYWWYGISRTVGYAIEASLVDIQFINFYNLKDTYARITRAI